VSTLPLEGSRRPVRLDAQTGALVEVCYELEVVRGPASGRKARFEAALTVGSGPEAGLQLDDPTVSRRHAELQPFAFGVRVRDLGSTNGVFINGVQVQDGVVESGLIELGRCSVQLKRIEEGVAQVEGPTTFGNQLGQSPAMRQLFGVLARVAPTDSTVLLNGETGTGKDGLARAIHDASGRRDNPYVVVDCAALAPSLVESELFGHAAGAYTGATSSRPGAFLNAHRGTVFLDEGGELPLDMQPRLLRVLESGTVKPVGADRPVQVDLRVIAATHKDLEREVEAGRFRRDLYYRLAVVMVRVPPLRERGDDVMLLAQHFVVDVLKGHSMSLSPELVAKLRAHRWPGNVRELRNAVERALAGGAVALGEPAEVAPAELPFKEAKERIVDAFTRDYLARLYERCKGNVSQMARESGINRNHVALLLERHGIRG
jgi:two-component system, NtrC family, response regulator GlrR